MKFFCSQFLATICGFCKSTHARRLRYEETYVAKGRSPVSHNVSKFSTIRGLNARRAAIDDAISRGIFDEKQWNEEQEKICQLLGKDE